MCDASSVLLSQDDFGYLWFPTNFRITFSISTKKKAIGILKGIALNLLGTRDMNTTWYHSYLDIFLKIDLRNSEGKGRFPEAGHAEVGRGW